MRKLHLFSIFVALSLATPSLWALTNNVDNGKLYGAFSVAAGTKVYFSQGNLQYQASTRTWRFALEQYHHVVDGTNGNVYENNVKCNNASISSSYSGWIDLYGWGSGDKPSNSSSSDGTFKTYSEWGNNAISNGGNQANLWRTLTHEEWVYLISTRTNANNLRTFATIEGVQGLILMPDNWTAPSGVSLTITIANFTTNVFNATNWRVLEDKGCVFLPSTGCRQGSTMYVDYQGNPRCYYWSSTLRSNQGYAYGFTFTNGSCSCGSSSYGNTGVARSVRLVSTTAPKMPASITKNPGGVSGLIYNGTSQTLITAGTASGGTMNYKLGNGSWVSTLPTAINAGTYTIYYKVYPDANHKEYIPSPNTIQVTISKADIDVSGLSVTGNNLYATGELQELVSVSGTFDGGTLKYSTDGINWSTNIPTESAADSYTIYYKIFGDSNHNDYTPSPATITATISKADLDVSGLSVTGNSLFANDSPQELVSVSGSFSGGTLKYSTDGINWSTDIPTESEVGTYTVYYMIEGDANHNDYTPVPAYITVSIEDYPYVADNEDPSSILEEFYAAGTAKDLKVKRTIYRNGEYNTICLPFALSESALAASPLAGFNNLKTIKGASVTGSGQALSIDIFVEDVTEMEAGKPYLISYPSANENIINPVFTDITVTETSPGSVTADGVTFQGMFAQVHIDPYDAGHTQDYLFLGANSQLMWPNNDGSSMRGFRAYFIIDRTVITPAAAPSGTRARFVNAPKQPTGIENTELNTKVQKLLENGQLIILKNGIKYNAQGQVLK